MSEPFEVAESLEAARERLRAAARALRVAHAALQAARAPGTLPTHLEQHLVALVARAEQLERDVVAGIPHGRRAPDDGDADPSLLLERVPGGSAYRYKASRGGVFLGWVERRLDWWYGDRPMREPLPRRYRRRRDVVARLEELARAGG